MAIASGNGKDAIADFELRQDRLGLTGDLSYDDLTSCGSIIYADNKLLVTLTGVDREQLTNQDLTINSMIPHKSN